MPNQKLTAVLMVVVLALCLSSGVVSGQTDAGQAGVLRNPLNAYGGADPWLQYYEGYYYLATTTWRSELLMSRSETLAGLKTAIPQQIYAESDPTRCCNMWAPEFHLLDGPNGLRWYFYYSAGTSGTLDNQHSHVLESAGTDPLGPYTYKGRIFDPANDVWSIDGSILQLNDELYFMFSSWVGANQSLFIAPMNDPWTISGTRVMISQPEYDWERMGLNVNEGPVALFHDDQVFIVYSASHCATPDYKLGLLTYTGGDPLDPASWAKQPEPVFQRSDENGVFGPGHNGFFTSPDGSEDWIIYHANSTSAGGCDDRRNTRVQKFTWHEDGTPNFGIPVSTATVIDAPAGDTGIDPLPDFAAIAITRFKSFSYETGYLRHTDVVLRIDVNVAPIADSQFMIVPGLADPDAISILSVNAPGSFLRHDGRTVTLAASDNSDAFAASATWWLRPGLADEAWISLEAYSQPNFYIGQKFGVMALIELSDALTTVMREDATFRVEQ